jgi:hypothetical protein
VFAWVIIQVKLLELTKGNAGIAIMFMLHGNLAVLERWPVYRCEPLVSITKTLLIFDNVGFPTVKTVLLV